MQHQNWEYTTFDTRNKNPRGKKNVQKAEQSGADVEYIKKGNL